MTESRVAALLRAHGVGTEMSVRAAASRVGVSRETLGRLMRPMERGETRRIHAANLDKIATGLDIPTELLRQAAMADWGFSQAVTGSTIGEVLAQLQDLDAHDLAVLQGEISRMQQARLRRPDVDEPSNG